MSLLGLADSFIPNFILITLIKLKMPCYFHVSALGWLSCWPGHTKDRHKNGTNCLSCLASMRLGRSLAVQPDCLKGRVVCGTVYGDMHLNISPGINHKSRVLYPSPGFLISATWHLMPKKHYNGLINQSTFLYQHSYVGIFSATVSSCLSSSASVLALTASSSDSSSSSSSPPSASDSALSSSSSDSSSSSLLAALASSTKTTYNTTYTTSNNRARKSHVYFA